MVARFSPVRNELQNASTFLLQYKECILENLPSVCNFAYLKCLAGHLSRVLPYDPTDGESEFQFCVLLAPQNDPGRVLTVLYKLAYRVTEDENLAAGIERGQMPNCVQQRESQILKVGSLLQSELMGNLMQLVQSVLKLKQKKLSKDTTSVEKIIKMFFMCQSILQIVRHLQTKRIAKFG